jgi:hypothetical protein
VSLVNFVILNSHFQKALSAPAGASSIFQGSTPFAAFDGALVTSYVGMNFQNGAGTATLSTWLFAPEMDLTTGLTVSFYTRTVSTPAFPDRLQVHYSTSGASVNAGATATSVGDFTLLLDINSAYSTSGYPTDWTQFTVSVPAFAGTGRVALRYFVENGGPAGSNSDYIGIDAFYATVNGAQTSGDPHFYGFKNQKYDVMGQSFEIYNIISTDYLQVNSRFTPYYKRVNQVTPTGTMMGDIGIKFYDERIELNSNSTIAHINYNSPIDMMSNWETSYEHGIVLRNKVKKNQYIFTITTPHVSLTLVRKVYMVAGMSNFILFP